MTAIQCDTNDRYVAKSRRLSVMRVVLTDVGCKNADISNALCKLVGSGTLGFLPETEIVQDRLEAYGFTKV